MTPEQQEFMHKRGEFIVINNWVHVLLEVGNGFGPADIKCEEYRSVCGAESQSWSMPSQGIVGAEFIDSLNEAVCKGIMICQDCLPGSEGP